MTVETLKHKDVRGNELYYLKLTNSKGSEHLINVGQKTLDKVQDLILEEQNSSPIQSIENNIKNGGKK